MKKLKNCCHSRVVFLAELWTYFESECQPEFINKLFVLVCLLFNCVYSILNNNYSCFHGKVES